MTVVECFDAEMSENLLAALRLQPERVVYVGTRAGMTDARIRSLRRFFAARRSAPALQFLRVGERDYAGAARALGDVFRKYDDCCLELTGGSDLLLAASAAAVGFQQVTLFELEAPTQTLRVLRPGRIALPEGKPKRLSAVSVAENARLWGGTLGAAAFSMGKQDPAPLRAEMDRLWPAFTAAPALWNRQCNLLAALSARSETGGLSVSAAAKTLPDRAHMERLQALGLIDGLHIAGNRIAFTFAGEQARRCLTRAGDLLELRVFLAALLAPDFFTDAVMGAQLGWGEKEATDTRNEIDGLAMHGAIPLFVSCKNGEVSKEALYELDTVSARFGGRHAARALVATGLSGSADSRRHLRSRAEDMGIRLIEHAEALSTDELCRELKRCYAAPAPALLRLPRDPPVA